MPHDTFDKRAFATALGVAGDVADLDHALHEKLADIRQGAEAVEEEVKERMRY
jgi:hypothetical protein